MTDYENLVKRLREIASHDGNIKSNYIGLTLLQAADAIEELNKLLKGVQDAHNEGYDVGYWAGRRDYEPKWIPVTERLPDDGEHALVVRVDYVTNTPFHDLLWFDSGAWWNRHFKGDYAVTHWMPLPEPPKEE